MSVLHGNLNQYLRTPSIWQFGLCCVLLAAGLLFCVPVASAQSRVELEVGPRDIRSLNLTEKQALAVTIQRKLQNVLDNMKPFPGQAPYTTVRVTFETELRNEVLVIDLGAANGPFSQSADMSELGGMLEEPVIEILDATSISPPAFDYEFGGRDASYYDPEKRPDSRPPRYEGYDPQVAIPPEDAKIVISAMHGYYVDMVDRVWKLQRPTRSNGIYEDFMTQKFVDPLVDWIFTRYGRSVTLAR